MTVEPRFLAHALALEEEAMQRYSELAAAMREHNNPAVADFFIAMSEESAKHLAEVASLVGDRALPELAAWEFDWPGEAPESASYEALHYRMDLGAAMALALANERAAQAFYAGAAETADDEETAALAREFAAEEAEHARILEARLTTLPDAPALHRQDDDPPHTPE